MPDPALAQQLEVLLGSGGGGGGGGGGAVPAVPDELAYSKKPRPVQYRPYGMRDYEERAYDVKSAPGYWQLGRLGPENENAELQAKREKNERIKQLARQINATNQERISLTSAGSFRRGSDRAGGSGGGARGAGAGGGGTQPGGGGAAPKEQSVRERAVEYARASVPRPEPARQKPHSSGAAGDLRRTGSRGSKGSQAAASGSGRGGIEAGRGGSGGGSGAGSSSYGGDEGGGGGYAIPAGDESVVYGGGADDPYPYGSPRGEGGAGGIGAVSAGDDDDGDEMQLAQQRWAPESD
ncbi:MAG: hypothetical protein J3K34DRAFT_205756 [Monoraphidium minutum]|nr:MAG: hypothetical protein J3K34DRAFT_205756 [Monoraphidium minutum]